MPTIVTALNQNVLRLTATTVGDVINYPSMTRRVQISNYGAQVLKIYTNPVDFAADTNYVDLTSVTGFYDGTMNIKNLYYRASAATTSFIIVVYFADGNLSG